MGFRAQHEIILHYTAGSPKYHDLGTSNVIRTSRVSAVEREHQTQKPVELMEALLNVVCPTGGTVLDPFMGSASTGVAAIKRGIKFIGIERDAEHFDTACKRIEEAWKQPRLFEEPKPKAEQLSLLAGEPA
jgi:DNA modification methylase